MLRTVYNEDHEAFRAAVREFLDRSVWPNVDSYIENKALPREYWLEAGRQGLLGLDIPEEFGGWVQRTSASTPYSPKSFRESTRRCRAVMAFTPTSPSLMSSN
ncbi:MAG: acyl-CoA dehydrogenase family protein [Marmoricola sp.]